MKQIKVNVKCLIDYKNKAFYFNIGDDGNPWPNYCDDYSIRRECQQCAVSSLQTLIEKAEEDLPYQSLIT